MPARIRAVRRPRRRRVRGWQLYRRKRFARSVRKIAQRTIIKNSLPRNVNTETFDFANLVAHYPYSINVMQNFYNDNLVYHLGTAKIWADSLRIRYIFNNNCPCDAPKNCIIKMVILKAYGNLNFGAGERLFRGPDGDSEVDFSATGLGPFNMTAAINRNYYKVLWEKRMMLSPTGVEGVTNLKVGKKFKRLKEKLKVFDTGANQSVNKHIILMWWVEPSTFDPVSNSWVLPSDVWGQVTTDLYWRTATTNS